MIYYLVLVTTLAACRLESTTEFCTDRSCDIPNSAKSEADSSQSNKYIDGGSTQLQKWSLQIIWDGVLNTAHKTFEKYVLNTTTFKYFSEKTKSWYNTTVEFTEALRTVFREEFFKFFLTYIPQLVNDSAFGKMIIICWDTDIST